jgi:centromeric protein E
MSEREFLIRVSYMEIYNEEINDLLVVEGQKLQIHESLEVGYLPVDFILSLVVNDLM